MIDVSLDDLKTALKNNVDEIWFINYFEITIEDLTNRFGDLIEEKQNDLPFELGLFPPRDSGSTMDFDYED